MFSDVLSETGALIRGDNLGALSVALKLSSTTPAMNAIAREIAWRRIVRRWQYLLKHLPAEQNDEADALSRLEAVPRRSLPDLGDAVFIAPPDQDSYLWRARLDYNAASQQNIDAKRELNILKKIRAARAISWNSKPMDWSRPSKATRPEVGTTTVRRARNRK